MGTEKSPKRNTKKKVEPKIVLLKPKKLHIKNLGKLYETVVFDGSKHILQPTKSMTIKTVNAEIVKKSLEIKHPTLEIKIGG